MDGPGGALEERGKLLEEWCAQAVNAAYEEYFLVPGGSTLQPGSGEDSKTDVQGQTDMSKPIALRKGKRKGHFTESDDPTTEPEAKKQNTSTIDNPLSPPESWHDELQKWFDNVAAVCETSDSTDSDSLLGEDVELLDVPVIESGEDSEDPAKVVRAEFGWSRAYRKWKRPLIFYPSLNAYELALHSLQRKSPQLNESHKQAQSMTPEPAVETKQNSFIGAFNQYYDGACESPNTDRVPTNTQLEPLEVIEATTLTDTQHNKSPFHGIPAQIYLKNADGRMKNSFVNFSPHLDNRSEWINNQTVHDKQTSLI